MHRHFQMEISIESFPFKEWKFQRMFYLLNRIISNLMEFKNNPQYIQCVFAKYLSQVYKFNDFI